jgi:hypothetical protein
MRRLLAIALPAALLLCAPATAKEVTAATVCGADGCRSIPAVDEAFLDGGPAAGAPSRREPFVRMEFRLAHGDAAGAAQRVRTLFLPGSGLVLGDDGTTWMRPAALAALREQARRVTPFAADRLPATAPLAARGSSPAPAGGGSAGIAAWWPVLPAALLLLLLAAALVRRSRDDDAAGAPA